MNCSLKHVKVQIPNEHWKCPKCGVGSETKEKGLGFIVESDLDVDCGLLHDDDLCNCYNCEYGTTGKRLSAIYAKKQNMVSCPHCKGTGMVKRPQ